MTIIFIEKLCGLTLAEGVIFTALDTMIREGFGFDDLPDGIMFFGFCFHEEFQGNSKDFFHLKWIRLCVFIDFIGHIADKGLDHAAVNGQHEVAFADDLHGISGDADLFFCFSESSFLQGFAFFLMPAGKTDIAGLIYALGTFIQNKMQFTVDLCEHGEDGEIAQFPDGFCLMLRENRGYFCKSVFLLP